MYYKDLTISIRPIPNDALNIGWLQLDHPYTKGKAPDGFLEKLSEYKEYRVMQTRGFHGCDFCEKNNRENGSLSSNEIRVVSKEGKIYASPMMIIHYVKYHNYLPPQEFIDAVMNGLSPKDSVEFWKEKYSQIISKSIFLGKLNNK